MPGNLNVKILVNEILKFNSIGLVDLTRISSLNDDGFLLENKNKYFSFHKAKNTGLGPGYTIECRHRNDDYYLYIISINFPSGSDFSDASQLIGECDLVDFSPIGGTGMWIEAYMVNGKKVSFTWKVAENKLIGVTINFPFSV